MMRKGFTLVECAVAGALLSLLSLALLGGVSVATRVANDNAQLLAADGVAFDAVWTVFNLNYGSIGLGTTKVELSEAAAPSLYYPDAGDRAFLTVVVSAVPGYDMKEISADVEWGPQGRRRRLSDFHETFSVRRSSLNRRPQ